MISVPVEVEKNIRNVVCDNHTGLNLIIIGCIFRQINLKIGRYFALLNFS